MVHSFLFSVCVCGERWSSAHKAENLVLALAWGVWLHHVRTCITASSCSRLNIVFMEKPAQKSITSRVNLYLRVPPWPFEFCLFIWGDLDVFLVGLYCKSCLILHPHSEAPRESKHFSSAVQRESCAPVVMFCWSLALRSSGKILIITLICGGLFWDTGLNPEVGLSNRLKWLRQRKDDQPVERWTNTCNSCCFHWCVLKSSSVWLRCLSDLKWMNSQMYVIGRCLKVLLTHCVKCYVFVHTKTYL